MNTMELLVVPLHQHPEYMLDCCDILNNEWKISETERLHRLQSSCDNLPTSLILLKGAKLIGHLQLISIPRIKTVCFIRSVVIINEMRGRGYGSRLMRKAEEYCKDFYSVDTIYLSTKGQEEFYEKLGYVECEPISIYGEFVPKRVMTELKKEQAIPPVPDVIGPPPPPLPKFNGTSEIRKTFMMKKLI